MAYINAKEVKQIREELKKQYPDIKWSVSKEDSTNVNVCMLEGNIDFSDIEMNILELINIIYTNTLNTIKSYLITL
jgi:membrane-bound lytic murein transglycosylase MltF